MKYEQPGSLDTGFWWALMPITHQLTIIQVYPDNEAIDSDHPEWDDLWTVLFDGGGYVDSVDNRIEQGFKFIEKIKSPELHPKRRERERLSETGG